VKTPAKFDRAKLLAFNLDAIQAMDAGTFLRRLRAHGERYHPEFLRTLGEPRLAILAAASQPRSKTLDEVFRGNRALVVADDVLVHERSKAVEKALLKGEPTGLDLLAKAKDSLAAIPSAEWSPARLEQAMNEFAGGHAGGNIGKVAQPLRVAVTGGTVSPPIFDVLAILGRDSTLRRIDRCLAAFAGATA